MCTYKQNLHLQNFMFICVASPATMIRTLKQPFYAIQFLASSFYPFLLMLNSYFLSKPFNNKNIPFPVAHLDMLNTMESSDFLVAINYFPTMS